MAATAIMVLPLMVIFDEPWRLPSPGAAVWASLAGMATLSTALGYVIFFRILSGAGAINVSLVTLLIPATAVLLGTSVLGEAVSNAQLTGMALIGAGLVAVDGRLWCHARWALAESARPVPWSASRTRPASCFPFAERQGETRMPPELTDATLDYLLAMAGLTVTEAQKADLQSVHEALTEMKARVRQPRGRMAELAHSYGFTAEDL
jgi:uncharacterized membrane protein